MAIGIRRFAGAGSRAINPARIQTGFGTDEDWSDTGISGLENTSTRSGSSAASTMNAQLARDKFKAEQDAAVAAAQRAQTGAQQQTDYLRKLLDISGRPFGGLEEQIAKQETEGRQYIADQAQMLADLISGRRTQAMETTTAGYDALRNYLAANPMQAFAQTQRAVPTVQQGILDQYMASRGISAAPAQAGQDVVNAQLAAQAANYNQLLNVLTGAEAQQQSSRAAEEQMARALAGTQLEALYAGQTSGLEQQRLAALNDLANRIAGARLQAEQARLAREQALQDAIAKLLGTGLVNMRPQEQGGANDNQDTPVNPTPVNPEVAAVVQNPIVQARYGDQAAQAVANLAAAGMSPQTIAGIAAQNIGNPLVVGGIPDYLRVIQEQAGQPEVNRILAVQEQPYNANTKTADQIALEQFVANSLANQYGPLMGFE